MNFGSLFSGIGGIDLGLERAGMQCRWQVEIDPFCRKILAKHWPHVKRYGDITKLDGRELEPVDLIAGGFPCQDLSQAGKRIGIEGPRSGLWFEFARIVRVLRPGYVLAENVPGLLTNPGAMAAVIGDLARCGYVGLWRCLRASEFGASHLRKRVFIVAELATSMPESGGADGRDGREIARCESETLAYGTWDGWTQGRAESGGVEGGLDASVNGGALGYPASARRAEAGIGCDLDTGGQPEAGRGELAEIFRMQFAPGPADHRWPRILAEHPDLAPALEYAQRARPGIHARTLAGTEATEESSKPAVGRFAVTPECPGADAPGEQEAPQPEVCRVADGPPDWLDRAMSDRSKRLSRLGNAVVPQVAEWLGVRIMQAYNLKR